MKQIKKIIFVLLSVIMCFSLISCENGKSQYEEESFFVMDTVFTLRLYGEKNEVRPYFTSTRALLTEIESALSCTLPESDVSRINAQRTAGELSHHTVAVLRIAGEAMLLTDGAYLPTMGAVTALWKEAGERDTLPDGKSLSTALAAARLGFSLEDGECTLLGEGALLDLGGIGKGYAADLVLAHLTEAGIKGGLLSFGSSVAVFGEKGNGEPFRISLRHPRESTATVGTLTSPFGVLSVSGDYERYVTVNGVRYHHVLDPQNGYPSDSGIASVAVLCESGAMSDALSTAFLVMGRERAEALLSTKAVSAKAVFITAAGEAFTTEGLELVTE